MFYNTAHQQPPVHYQPAKIHVCTFTVTATHAQQKTCLNGILMTACMQAHLDSFVAVNFIDSLEELDVKPEVKRVLTRLCQLHALHRIVTSSGEFLEVRIAQGLATCAV